MAQIEITESAYFYSAQTNAFYPSVMRDDYKKAGTWPDDALVVDDAIYNEYAAGPVPTGKIRVAGADGLPVWGDAVKATLAPAEQAKRNMEERRKLAGVATINITALQSMPQEQGPLLTQWQAYIAELASMSTSELESDSPAWPIQPEAVL